MKKKVHLFAQISKIDEAKREVWGVATSEAVDKDGEVFDYSTSKPYFKAWSDEIAKATEGKSLGNVREMHEPSAVGKLVEIGFDDELKEVRVGAKIVDDEAWRKCTQGVYTGFSIGGTYVKAWKEGEHTRYTAKPVEISVVDNPCNPGAHFTAVKVDGSWEVRKFATSDLRVAQATGRTRETKGEREEMEKIGAKHSAETRAHHEALNQCVGKIAQACSDAQDHVDALLGKDDADGSARPEFVKQSLRAAQAETKAGEQSMKEQQSKDLEKVATDSALALAKVAELESSVVALRSEMKRSLEDIGQALINLTEAIAKVAGDSSERVPRAARAVVPSITITKEDDARRGDKAGEEGKSVHELLKRALQNPQRASSYLR